MPGTLAAAGSDLVFDLRREDQERTAQLLRDGVVMAAVAASAEPVAGCTAERLGRMRYRPRCRLPLPPAGSRTDRR
jgi:LysR family transcriptional regulator (chromosome initiation inhibitor)